MDLDNESPWEGILSSTMFAIRSMLHTATQHTSSQLVFGSDTVLNITREANCWFSKQHKHARINEGDQKENLRRQSHVYRTGDNVLLKNAWKMKFNQDTYIGPYSLTEVENNGSGCACKGNIIDTYSLCNIIIFQE